MTFDEINQKVHELVFEICHNQYDSHSITTAGSASMDFVIIYHSM